MKISSRWECANLLFLTYEWKAFYRNWFCSHQENKLYSETSSLLSQLASLSHSIPHLQSYSLSQVFSKKVWVDEITEKNHFNVQFIIPINWEDVTLKQCPVLWHMAFLFRHELYIYWAYHGSSMYVCLCNNQFKVMGDSVASNINPLSVLELSYLYIHFELQHKFSTNSYLAVWRKMRRNSLILCLGVFPISSIYSFLSCPLLYWPMFYKTDLVVFKY